MSESGNKETKDVYLPEIIEKTRKSRIEAERRLLQANTLAQHSSVYYACITSLLTLLSVFTKWEPLPFLSVASAVTLTIITVYASSQNYCMRAQQIKECYLDLQSLSLELDSLSNNNSNDQIDIIGERYLEILKRTENHLPKDYEKVISQRDHGVNSKHPWDYYLTRIAIYLGPIILFMLLSFFFW